MNREVSAAPDAPAPQLRHHSMHFSTLSMSHRRRRRRRRGSPTAAVNGQRSTVVDQPARGNLWRRESWQMRCKSKDNEQSLSHLLQCPLALTTGRDQNASAGQRRAGAKGWGEKEKVKQCTTDDTQKEQRARARQRCLSPFLSQRWTHLEVALEVN